MTRKLAHFVPAFLKRIDQYLLLNHPALWVSKIHFVLFYGVVATLFVGVVSLIPVSPYDLPDVETHFGMAIIPASLGFLFWGWQVGRINVERFFGETSLKQRLFLQGIYLLCVAIFASFPFLYGQSVAYRTAHSIPTDRLVDQINTFHLVQDYVFEADINYYEPFIGDKTLHDEGLRYRIYSQMNNADKRQALREYFALIELYTESQLSHGTKQAIHDAFIINQAQVGEYNLSIEADNIHEIRRDFDRIANSKKHWERQNWGFQEAIPLNGYSLKDVNHAPVALGMMVFFLFLFMMLYVRMQPKTFFLSLITGTAILMLGGLAISLMDSSLFYHIDSDLLVGLLFFGGMILCGIMAFLPGKKRTFAFWRRTSLMLLVIASPFILMFGYMTVDALNNDVTPLFIFGWGTVITLVLWNGLFEGRFLAIQADPHGH
ncbi:MAG: hypothetical protein AAF587_05240 [Bacteroidota bacterium]